MVKARNKEEPPVSQPQPNQPIPTPQVVNLTVLNTDQYNSLLTRLQRLENYIAAFSQTYEIKNGSGTPVVY